MFLATLLVLGTIATILPSAQADSYYGIDSYKKKSNAKDVSVKSVKCNNVNLNVNGIGLNTTSVPFLNNLLASEGQDGYGGASSYGSGSYGDRGQQSGYDKNSFKFVCVNNNNNTVVVVNETTSEEPEEPTTGTLRVIKQVTCTEEQLPDSISVQQAVTPCQVLLELRNENDFIIRVEGNNPTPSQFRGSPEGTEVTLRPSNYIVTEERPDPTFPGEIFQQFPNIAGGSFGVRFTGDCTDQFNISATGTIAAGESQTCNIENFYTINLRPQSGGIAASDINTDTSSSNINTAGGLASSFSSPPTIAQGTEDLSALEKVTKLKQQWLDLLP